MTTNTFHFTRNPELGRPISGSKLYAAGQRKDATDLDSVKLMADTDKAARTTEDVLQTLERYTSSLRFYDGEPGDFNSEPGKLAVSQGVVAGAISCWKYYADATMEFDPVTMETRSLSAVVKNAPTERFELRTEDDGVKRLAYDDDWGRSYRFAIDDKQGTITAIFES
jgi:hypothetical protein